LHVLKTTQTNTRGGIIGLFREDFGEHALFDQADAFLTRIIPMLVKLCKAK
jgi:hypothetical protein